MKKIEVKKNAHTDNYRTEDTETTQELPHMDDEMSPEMNEKFLEEPSKVQEVLQFLDQMANANKMDEGSAPQKPLVDSSGLVTDENFLVFKRISFNDRMSIKRSKSKNKIVGNTNQFTFMRQIDETQERRVETRIERERVADNYRRLGNFEYRRNAFEAAIQFYTRGLGYIVDTPVLYVNRALCHIKYLRAWLYRAAAYKRLNDEKSFEESVYQAKSLNSSEIEYIEKFLDKMRTML
ncbi:tetratricopeptide repeat protein 12 isoform X2 [Drosophila willistoni]|uniref:tetratricopeptide repeat protein 12 isoform X2 n=1 Tax=Drosophila willistoni TaxID=7260 RepID=UPI001F083790|nr:tetratricopeptide repeat protein 12 isoform X2 [Drosophila willistoni]